MKKVLFPVLGISMLILSACSSGGAAAPQATATPAAQAAQAQRTPVPLPQEEQLLIGTLKLSGAQGITKEQAAKLLPLWQRVRDLSATTTQGQISPDTQAVILGITQQISAAMTPEQTKAIADMNITRETMVAVMQEQGIELAPQGDRPQGGFTRGSGTPQADGQAPQGRPQGTPGAGRQGGQPPVGAQGQNFRGGGGMFVPTELYDAVIQMLQKVGAG